MEEMKGQYVEDEDFARIYDQIVNGQRHEHYTLKIGFPVMHGKLCVTKQLRPKVLIECHAPPYAGHCGIDAIVKAVGTFFYWPTLRRDVDAFVKFDRQKAPRLLQPLQVLDKPWESIAMDFIFDLPRTPTGNDRIWTIICRFNKQAHFVPVRKKIKSEHVVKLFMHNVFKYHGMPQSILSDWDPRMMSLFWKALLENMGTTLKFSSFFHPQTDGQSEEANSTVLDMLKCYVSEHKATWEHNLPLVEYAYNNTVHTTGKVPFEIVEGGKKVPPILQTKDKIFEADKYVQNTDEAHKKIKLALEKTQSKQKKVDDRHRRELVFSLGDWVLLPLTSTFEKARLRKMEGKERLFPKLGMRYYGPFQVCDKISDVAYRLKFPEGWKIHNAFHVSLLRPFVGDVPEDMVPKEQPKVEDLSEILVPEQILAHKNRRVRGKVARRYLVNFKNYSPMDAKWTEEADLIIAIRDIIRPPNRAQFNDVYIVYELMDTDLHQIIRSNQPLTEDHCQYFLYQLLRGLKYIHSANVLHRDLKPSNLLLNANCDLKICDFGLARTTAESDFMTEYVVTRWYRAPELLLNCSEYTAAIDIWSVGCIFMEILNREALFPGRDYVQQLRLITELIGSPNDEDLGFLRNANTQRYIKQLPRFERQPLAQKYPHINAEAIDLVDKMLVFDPAKRITVEAALSHPYLASLHDINDEPSCNEPFSFDFEQHSFTEEHIKELIWLEALSCNPDNMME
ncbi:hypothetical protein L7F22_061264 [Adiantum nelumboides]|nr:hypothetical protein [Adiantum nelumboides]